jgi:hypothetical protein
MALLQVSTTRIFNVQANVQAEEAKLEVLTHERALVQERSEARV